MKLPTPSLSPCASFSSTACWKTNQFLLGISSHAFTCGSRPFRFDPGPCLPLLPLLQLQLTLLASIRHTDHLPDYFTLESFQTLSLPVIHVNHPINYFCPLRLHTGITSSSKYYLTGLDAFPEHPQRVIQLFNSYGDLAYARLCSRCWWYSGNKTKTLLSWSLHPFFF